MKKFVTFVGAAALLAATLVPAFAAGSNCVNSTTGPGSNNTCTVNNASTVKVNNVNDAQIVNNVTSRALTGGNSASNNTLGGSVTTGNATLNSYVSSVANVNTTNVSVGWAGSSNMGYNEITGPFSDNNAYVNNAQLVDVYNSNTATVNNRVDSKADTGLNRADNNTGPGSVRSGSAMLGVVVGNHVNDSFTALSLSGGGTGNNTAGNSTTGPFSTNNGTVNNATTAFINNVNDLQVVNGVMTRALTGRNSASNNTLGGSVTSGDAQDAVGVDTEGNINTTQVAMAMGAFSNDASNGVTGPDSNNYTYINNIRTVLYDNWNNKCRSHNAPYRDWKDNLGDRDDSFIGIGDDDDNDKKCNVNDLGVFNIIDDMADTGNNHGDNNTGGSDVVAGWASLIEELVTHLNDNLNVISL